MKEIYWYKMTNKFEKLDDVKDIFEIRQESPLYSDGEYLGSGGVFILTKIRLDNYYEDLGLEYVGVELLEED